MAKPSGAKSLKTLQATVEQAGEHLSIRWEIDEDGGQIWEPYEISLDEIHVRTNAVLDALKRLEATDWSDMSGAEQQPNLRNLVEVGLLQYETIITGHGRTAGIAKQFRDWFETEVASQNGEWRIQVVHHQYDAPLICWGLTFTPMKGLDLNSLSTDWEDYQGFWAVSLKLACRGVLLKQGDRITEPFQGFEGRVPITLDVDEDLLDDYKASMSEDDWLRVSGQFPNTIHRVLETSRSNELQNVFWYVSLEQESGVYIIDDDELSINTVRKARDNLSRILVMFLDGDSVIRGRRGMSWVETLLHKGRTGLISTEVDIKNPQLTYFGWQFYRYVISAKKPLIEAIYDARLHQDFWPKSLLYGVYCDPLRIYFIPPPDGEIKAADNFIDFVLTHREGNFNMEG